MTQPSFLQTLKRHQLRPLRRAAIHTLQVNVGKLCNQACQHCHVEAGPKRTEMMDRVTADRLLELLHRSPSVEVVDLTGGAPELNPHFRYLVESVRAVGKSIIDRCNLTVLFEPGQEDLAEFLAEHQVRIVASLPCYEAPRVEAQRGLGVYDKSIAALRRLNELGYGRGRGLPLDLVYNPLGPSLPPPQEQLERTYKQELRERFGVEFDQLLTITNMPIKRFAHQLHREGHHDEYMSLLERNFNPATVAGLMCRSMVSVGYDGTLYDCDFNQMLELSLGGGHLTLDQLQSFDQLLERPIQLAAHCFGCTAGAGSSCGGALE